MAKTVFLLTKGEGDKTYFNRAGVAFDPNRDGSVNFKLDIFPNLSFQIRENKSDANEEPNGRNNPDSRQRNNR
jgi:hypothetical protein